MTLSRFTLWEFGIGGACAVAFLVLTGASQRGTLLGLLIVALAAAVLAKHLLAIVGTFLAIWVALPLWASVIPGADDIPTVSAVIEPSTTTTEVDAPVTEPTEQPQTTTETPTKKETES